MVKITEVYVEFVHLNLFTTHRSLHGNHVINMSIESMETYDLLNYI